ncbi:MAG: flippase [Chloroflexota bacterium]
MSNTRNSIAKNASVLMLSQVTTWVLTLVLMLFLPRFVGAEGMGQLHLASSIWIIMGKLIAFGTDTLLTKEIARRPEKLSELVGATFVIRVVLYAAGFGLMAVGINLAGYSPDTITVIYIIGLADLVMQFSGTGRVSLLGLERMEYVAIANIATRAFITVGTLVVLLLGYGVFAAAIINIGGALVAALVHFYYLRRLQTLKISFNWEITLEVFKAGAPYLAVYAFSVIYMQLDAVIISLLVNETVVGWYGVADQLFGTFMFVPTVFITAVFPALSRMYANADDSVNYIMRKSFDLLLLLSVPIGLGVAAIADPLVILLFGNDFAASGPVLAVMGIVLILTYQNILLGQFLISTDRQNAWTVVMAIATLATIPLDIVLVPWCQATFGNGAIGGAVAFIITELGMVAAGLWLLPKGSLGKENAWIGARVLFAGLTMFTAVWFLRHTFIVIPIAVGAVVYGALILLLRVIPAEDWELIQSFVQNIRYRFQKRQSEPVGL